MLAWRFGQAGPAIREEVWISQTYHAVTGVIAVAAVTRAAIKTLPRVIQHETEKCRLRTVTPEFLRRLAQFNQMQGFRLSVKGELFKGNLIDLETSLAKGFKPQAVALLVAGKYASQLAVNVENDPRVGGAGSVITGDDLFAYCNQQPGFGF